MSNTGDHEALVDPRDLLLQTDWNAVEHCCPDVAPATPVILLELLDEDPVTQGWALRSLVEAHTRQQAFPLRAGLLSWLGDSVVEAMWQRERPYGDEEDLEAFLDLAPEFHAAARPFLDAGCPEVRGAALGVLLAVLRLPALAGRIPGHRDRVRAAALVEGPYRRRAVDTLSCWGEEVSSLL
ncbi:hypothetical protein [Streptomyces virginiae]|uniref:hypothetical protein n=1 Tax=Streptomyces virginiae TaxID=1961 RepID=UPI00343923ED